ncbi:glycosyltransferase [Pseudoalteromonas piratica]|uniref:glycosyltransferase n=1 Tax=Pseudoalteromonas piratica TaxID=1348114 RepID=UPI00068C977D|nr:glycosyltransferase [Pseudoalteromonas piratica]
MNQNIPVIIIPAYNERSVIARTLTPIYPGIEGGDFSIVLAVNGTTDDTVDFVKQTFPKVNCLDIEIGSKTNAINEAEKLNVGFPRVYMDADVVLTLKGIKSLIDRLASTKQPLLAAPKAEMDFSHSSFLVKAFYQAWFKTKFYTEQGFGGGVYGLNEAARSNFERFPKIIADDGFIREVVCSSQHSIVNECISIVSAPRDIRSLIKIKSRSKLGNMELKKKGLIKNAPLTGKRFEQSPSLIEFIVYGVVNVIATKFAQRSLSSLESYTWQKDSSSREVE